MKVEEGMTVFTLHVLQTGFPILNLYKFERCFSATRPC